MGLFTFLKKSKSKTGDGVGKIPKAQTQQPVIDPLAQDSEFSQQKDFSQEQPINQEFQAQSINDLHQPLQTPPSTNAQQNDSSLQQNIPNQELPSENQGLNPIFTNEQNQQESLTSQPMPDSMQQPIPNPVEEQNFSMPDFADEEIQSTNQESEMLNREFSQTMNEPAMSDSLQQPVQEPTQESVVQEPAFSEQAVQLNEDLSPINETSILNKETQIPQENLEEQEEKQSQPEENQELMMQKTTKEETIQPQNELNSQVPFEQDQTTKNQTSDFADEEIQSTNQESEMLNREFSQTMNEPAMSDSLQQPIQEPTQEPAVQEPIQNEPEEETDKETENVILTQGQKTEIYVEKKKYQGSLLMMSDMEKDVRRASKHLTRMIDDEAIITAKLTDWYKVMNSMNEQLMMIDKQIFEKGETHE